MKPNESRKSIQVIVFAEGGSPRLRPLTEHLPSCLVPVGGTPILDQQIQTLLRTGIRSITVLGGYRAAQVEQACRHYEGVLFRVNPRFTRGEPVRSALTAAAPEGVATTLLVRGDLVFDEAMIHALLESKKPDGQVVGPQGKGIGLCKVSPETLRTLLAMAPAPAPGPEAELFPWVETQVAAGGGERIPVADHPWARVASLEDLARALKAARQFQAARVAETETRLMTAGPADSREAGAPGDPVDPDREPRRPAVPSHAVAGSSTLISRSLLRVLPR